MMNRNSMFLKDPSSPDIFIAGVCLRKKRDKEIFSRLPLYNPEDYEVLLKNQSTGEASYHYWEITCTSLKGGRDPQMAIIQDMYTWTKSLAGSTTSTQPVGLRSKRAVFLSLHGGAGQLKNSTSTLKASAPAIILCYLLPTTHKASSVVDSYPSEPQKYPTFKCLKTVLKGMRSGSFNVHPFTMEMLSSLDNWLREKHSIPDVVNHLFTQALSQRLQKFCINPMYRSDKKVQVLSPSESFVSASHLFQALSTSTNAFAVPVSPIENVDSTDDGEAKKTPVDIFVRNAYFGQKSPTIKKVNILVVNENFGKGVPDYDAIRKIPKQISSTVIAEPQMAMGFPLHQYAMNGNVEGVRTCANSGLSVNDKDDESWTPLHYACWCGYLDVAKALVLELQADVTVKEKAGSTPLHVAAKNGHADVVSFLLTQPGINPNDTDTKGRTPLQACLDHKNHNWQSVVEMLKEARPVPAVTSEPGSSAVSKAVRLRVEFMSGLHKILVLPEGQNTPSSTILKKIYEHIHLPLCHYAAFSLWLKSDSVELPLGNNDKPLIILNSNWHQIVQHLSLSNIEVPIVCVQRNVHFPVDKEKTITDPITIHCLFADAYQRVLKGYYPCSEDGAVYLAGIVLSITHGDYNKALHSPEFLNDKLAELIPTKMAHSRRKGEFIRRILEQYEQISQEDISDHTILHLKYLKYCWQWQFYGAMFFPGILKPHSMLGRSVNIRLGINHLGYHIVNAEDNVLNRTVGLEGTEWGISHKNKEVTLKQQGGESTTVIKSKYIQIIEKVAKKFQEKKDEKSSQS